VPPVDVASELLPRCEEQQGDKDADDGGIVVALV
jgi:hypothetical protein